MRRIATLAGTVWLAAIASIGLFALFWRIGYFRHAVSVFFALVAVALCVLWVRSYWAFDSAGGPVSSTYLISFISTNGKLEVAVSPRSTSELARPQTWGLGTYPHHTTYTYPAIAGYATVPHWLAILSAIGLGTVPWYASHYSVRTMLIATTLFAIVLGLGVWASR